MGALNEVVAVTVLVFHHAVGSVCYLCVCFLNMTEGTLKVLEFPPVAACAFLLGH